MSYESPRQRGLTAQNVYPIPPRTGPCYVPSDRKHGELKLYTMNKAAVPCEAAPPSDRRSAQAVVVLAALPAACVSLTAGYGRSPREASRKQDKTCHQTQGSPVKMTEKSSSPYRISAPCWDTAVLDPISLVGCPWNLCGMRTLASLAVASSWNAPFLSSASSGHFTAPEACLPRQCTPPSSVEPQSSLSASESPYQDRELPQAKDCPTARFIPRAQSLDYNDAHYILSLYTHSYLYIRVQELA